MISKAKATPAAPPPQTEPPRHIGDVIKKYRRLRGISQHTLGVAIGVTGSAVGQWESGENEPKPETRALIIGELDIPTEELLLGFAPAERTEAETEDIRRLIDLANNRPHDATLSAIEMLRAWPDKGELDQAGLVGLLKSYFSMAPEKRREARAIIDVLSRVKESAVPVDLGAQHDKKIQDPHSSDVPKAPRRRGRPPKIPNPTGVKRSSAGARA